MMEDVHLTFGPYQGLRLSDLIAGGDTGADYLEWGITHLKSSLWRDRFFHALQQTPRRTHNLLPYAADIEKRLMLLADPMRSLDEIDAYLQRKQAQWHAAYERQQARTPYQQSLLAWYAPFLDISEEALLKIVTEYGGETHLWDTHPEKRKRFLVFRRGFYGWTHAADQES